jgi:hypothetical protein
MYDRVRVREEVDVEKDEDVIRDLAVGDLAGAERKRVCFDAVEDMERGERYVAPREGQRVAVEGSSLREGHV